MVRLARYPRQDGLIQEPNLCPHGGQLSDALKPVRLNALTLAQWFILYSSTNRALALYNTDIGSGAAESSCHF